MAQLVAEGAASMGALLRDAEAQHRKSCDTDMSGCGVLNSVNHFLQAAPRVFTLQVGRVWCGVGVCGGSEGVVWCTGTAAAAGCRGGPCQVLSLHPALACCRPIT